MPATWIDVADNFIKIGLSAIIAGVFTYKAIYAKHKSDQAAEKEKHRREIILNCTNKITEIFDYFAREALERENHYFDVMNSSSEGKYTIPPDLETKWLADAENIMSIYREVTSHLLLIQEAQSVELLKEAKDLMMIFIRNHENERIANGDYKKLNLQHVDYKKKIFNNLSGAFVING